MTMATAKTGSFWVTETVTLTAAAANGSRFGGSIDLGSYIDVGDQQAVSVELVDAVWQQSSDYGVAAFGFLAGNGSVSYQVSDLNPATAFIRADDNSLIASGALNIDQGNNITSNHADFYPDLIGKNTDESKIVVNDTLYVVAGNDGAAVGAADLYLVVRARIKIIKLSQKDWMTVAISSVAND
jgi:hypothetical protein